LDEGSEIIYGRRIKILKKHDPGFIIIGDDGVEVMAQKIILATGGVTYKNTGSSGDGFDMARNFGHTVTELRPGLAPLKVKESFVKDLQGLSFEEVRLTYFVAGKKKVSQPGDILFTHFGLSGPMVLDISGALLRLVENEKEVKLIIDFKPEIKEDELEKKLSDRFFHGGSTKLKNIMSDIIPGRMAIVFLESLSILPDKLSSQVTKSERLSIAHNLKAFTLTVIGSLPMDEAMVTQGGIFLKEINPRTMESKIVPGLYFAGEMIESAGVSGGYNLQQAFSTGYLAGETRV
jgi:predicted Rossmann fold flavoprotein